jgi:cytosine/uracil/thiamine/allantoin permease
MTALRLISLPTHAVLELVLGVAVLAAPFALGFGPAGLVVSVALGALIVGLALSAAPETGTSVAAHFAYDRVAAFGLVFGALALALANDSVAAVFLAGTGLVQTVLNLTTRYTART